ncbi:MAG: multiprotein-bridging factor 1 family protein [Streptosporangiales bacterium]
MHAVDDFAVRLRQLMAERGLGVLALARLVPCDRAHISRLAHGTRCPSPQMGRRLDAVLEAGGELAALARAARAPMPRTGQASSAAETITVPCRTPDGRIILVTVPRRAFLQGLGTAAAAAAVPASLAAALPAPEPSAERFALARKALRDSDNLFGPQQVIPAAMRQLGAVQRAARAVRGGAQRDIVQVQAEFADLIGWLYQDSGDHAAAGYWLDRALEWSHLAGDRGSVAFIFARKSQLAADMHDPAGAVAAADAALRLAAPQTRVAAAAAAYAAHGHALSGDRAASDRSYGHAAELLDGAGDDASPWAAFCDHAYLGVQQAHSLSVLGDAPAAADGFHEAITRLQAGYHRDRGVYLAREAVARAGAGDLDHAASLGMQALAVGTETLSARVFAELAVLDSRLARNPAPPAAAQFRKALDSAVLSPA